MQRNKIEILNYESESNKYLGTTDNLQKDKDMSANEISEIFEYMPEDQPNKEIENHIRKVSNPLVKASQVSHNKVISTLSFSETSQGSKKLS
jgi:hypothetical protein